MISLSDVFVQSHCPCLSNNVRQESSSHQLFSIRQNSKKKEKLRQISRKSWGKRGRATDRERVRTDFRERGQLWHDNLSCRRVMILHVTSRCSRLISHTILLVRQTEYWKDRACRTNFHTRWRSTSKRNFVKSWSDEIKRVSVRVQSIPIRYVLLFFWHHLLISVAVLLDLVTYLFFFFFPSKTEEEIDDFSKLTLSRPTADNIEIHTYWEFVSSLRLI